MLLIHFYKISNSVLFHPHNGGHPHKKRAERTLDSYIKRFPLLQIKQIIQILRHTWMGENLILQIAGWDVVVHGHLNQID